MINEQEDAEDKSSSSRSHLQEGGLLATDDNLEEFRSQWEEEIMGYKKPSKENARNHEKSDASKDDETDEDKARRLFGEGVELEKRGQPFQAMALYRKAMLLVPEIEHIIYEKNKQQYKKTMKNKANMESMAVQMQNELKISDVIEKTDAVEVGEEEEEADLVSKFEEELLLKGGKYIERPGDGNVIITSKHISDLPMEIILYLMKWIVSADLDLKSLENAANVCKGFYLCARDKEIWRLICFKIWGFNVGTLEDSLYSSWREMYMNRSHLLFHGCYISRTTYLRTGENNFQDKYHQSLQLVVYYRYFKFFPDGTVTTLTTADEPHKCVNRMKYRYPTHSDIWLGHYRIVDDTVIILVKREKDRKTISERNRIYEYSSAAKTVNIEFTIVSTKKRKNAQLIWKSYSLVQNDQTVAYELTNTQYPSLQFSRVKTYQTDASVPLQ